jgi:hypothetical protein
MLEPFMLTFTSPPVATARYLRAAFAGQLLHITYAGACPGAEDESIDARLRPSELFDVFLENGIVIGAQPNCFDALVPLDRRRFYSLPGGTPARDHVERVSRRELIELTGDDVVLELTQQLIEQTPSLIDLAPSLGCACAGSGEHAMRGNARAGLLTLEPPRARQRVLDASVQVDVSQTLDEACALQWSAAEETTELEVHLAADSAPAPADVAEVDSVGDSLDAPALRETTFVAAMADEEVLVADETVLVDDVMVANAANPADEAIAVISDVLAEREQPAAALYRRRPVSVRSAASLPRYASETGESVPRASLAVLRRALARIATRKARRQPKVERGRRERNVELRDGLGRTVARTPRSLAIPAAELPRPVPPPPARRRPRTMLEM